jgi:hypothetical protein
MCKTRKLMEESLINEAHRPISERSIQILMRKQLALMALIDTMTTTADEEKRKSACQGVVDIMKELKNMNAKCTCGLN